MGTVGLRGAAARALVVALAGCGVDVVEPDTGSVPEYADVVALFDRAIAPTCSLNNGVCHNSNNYPDLHTVANLIATVEQPCNVEITDPVQVHDVCEPLADRLVVASAGIDARIVRASLDPGEMELPADELTKVVLTLDSPPAGLEVGASDTVVVRRDGTMFMVGEYGADVVSVNGSEVVLDLRAGFGDVSAKRFFDVRVYPPGPLRVHVGDPNGNAIEGAMTAAMPLVAPGEPARSYLMHRLVDPAYGELMPRQCRTWNDAANLALACWIRGLAVEGGEVTNAYAPIDYAACDEVVAGLGRCP